MNVLFVTGHPAQVHNFRHVRSELENKGHNVFWLTTPKDIATNLLSVYQIPYTTLQKPKKNILSQFFTLIRNVVWEIFYLKRNKIDIVITRTDPYTAIAAWLCRIPNIMLQDTEHAAKSKLQGPFARYGAAYIVPNCFCISVRKDELKFPGNIELFYLNTKRYTPTLVWNLLGIAPNTKYALVRFVKWDAFHDTNLIGGFTLNQKRELINRLTKHMRVFISSEVELPVDLEPYRIQIPIDRMHDVQTAAALFIGESATMASESVVLGTPAIYIDEVGRGYTDEEAREELLWMYRPVPTACDLKRNEPKWISGGVRECIEKAEEIVSNHFDSIAYHERYKAWLSKKIDCTAFLTWFIENYPDSQQQTRLNQNNDAFWVQFK